MILNKKITDLKRKLSLKKVEFTTARYTKNDNGELIDHLDSERCGKLLVEYHLLEDEYIEEKKKYRLELDELWETELSHGVGDPRTYVKHFSIDDITKAFQGAKNPHFDIQRGLLKLQKQLDK